MRFSDQFSIAMASLVSHPLRTALTMLGMIVGVGAVVAMVSIGLGARHQIELEINRLGTRLLMAQSVVPEVDGLSGGDGGPQNLSEADAQALRAEIYQVEHSVPVANGGARVVFGNSNWSTSVAGTTPEYLPARDWGVSHGRSFTEAEVASMAKVALVGKTINEQLSPLQPLTGRTIRVDNIPFEVVGILQEKGYSVVGRDQDDVIIVPITTAKRGILARYYQLDRDAVTYILIKVRVEADAGTIERLATRILRHRHGIAESAEADFVVRDPMAALSARKSASEAMTLLLACVSAVSLVVGGISIMNIMLVSVAERTREIGIRIAVGASSRDIQTQFLAEAAGVAIAGGIIGIAGGIGAAYAIKSATGWYIRIDIWVVMGAVLFATFIGLLSGLYPAYKAAGIDPIEAIRHE